MKSNSLTRAIMIAALVPALVTGPALSTAMRPNMIVRVMMPLYGAFVEARGAMPV